MDFITKLGIGRDLLASAVVAGGTLNGEDGLIVMAETE
jgi:hypothetical protein